MSRSVSGFTLIEIILALVLAGLLASLAGPNMVGSLVGSSKALQDLGTAVTLQSTMEKIVNCYSNSTMSVFIDTCIPNNMGSGYAKDAAKSGYCKLTGSTFSVDNTLTSGMYALTVKSTATGESLTMLFPGK
ncbi:prepilin-type N-terminal cleavage/methylation domain-containing protein [Desulfovibrio sp. DV]|uniref:prepilin-type N-terminal cleavage/methylation domain-containing protein n=1 Tax=Desulfovibrio sp. DV TaxID=1844708 RepID=UPI0011153630|nr:prepilin-type N-terminal cleavage/methylation domain-containing protein [Desulfovibrio sp. DV]